jgi:hypothetical protein
MTKKKPRSQWKRMGRPPVPDQQRRSVGLTVRMTQQEYQLLQSEARTQGVTASELLLLPWR